MLLDPKYSVSTTPEILVPQLEWPQKNPQQSTTLISVEAEKVQKEDFFRIHKHNKGKLKLYRIS